MDKLYGRIRFGAVSAIALAAALAAGDALAGAVITNAAGDLAIGVNNEGHLNTVDPTGTIATSNTYSGYVGLAALFNRSGSGATWQDATAPGCLCEGWGVSANGTVGAAASVDLGGVSGMTLDSFSATATQITSKVSINGIPGLTVTQTYAVSSATDRLFENKVTISNRSGGALNNVKYVRVMDWDVPPTEFSEFVTIKGTASTTLLELSHDNGFSSPNPLHGSWELVSGTTNVDFTDSGPADHGAYFKFNFGTLEDNTEYSFSIFYGAAATEALALAAIGAAGIELYSLGQQYHDPAGGTPMTYIFGFKGVGGVAVEPNAVPVPAAAALFFPGAALVGWIGRRRRA